jgi:hypothetical protein
MKRRNPAVAGYFYPSEESELKKMIAGFIKQSLTREDVLGAVAPHAGYIYSGSVASELYLRINIPPGVIILCPNHTGLGKPFSLWKDGSWLTPLGEVKIDPELTQLLKDCSKLVREDPSAHLREHSAEVQLPFLQYHRPDVKIAVVCISSTSSTDELGELIEFGSSLGEALKNFRKNTLIIASSDMNHYESHKLTLQKDSEAIKEIEKLSEEGLFKVVKEKGISMCGYAPTISMISACKTLGATYARLLVHTTSGEISGDFEQVVGYAAIVVK